MVLKPRRARPFFGRHPWVFTGSIARIEGDPADGAEVDLVSHEGRFIARGLFNGRSNIRVRLYCWEPHRPLTADFWRERLTRAVRFRRAVLRVGGPERACRLVFSESDGLSGLTVDQYDRWLVVQFTSLALAQRRDLMLELLDELLHPAGIQQRTERGIGTAEGLQARDEPIRGEVPDGPITILEHDLSFGVDLRTGQKTGFYLDQRDNRRAILPYTVGRRVLDAFCYTGGFAIAAAAQGGASEVRAVDASSPAIELARTNAERNGVIVGFEVGDVFHTLGRYEAEGERFGVVICDPPKFARSARSLGEALKGYRRLNRLAVDLLEADGILVTCSCSGLMSRELFAGLLGEVVEDSGRDIQILEQRGQAADHPVSASCPETNYLKCLICRVS